MSICHVFNVFSKPRIVEEVIELHTTAGAAGLLCRTKLSCSFVTPVVKFSEETINFRVEVVGTLSRVVVLHSVRLIRSQHMGFGYLGVDEPGYLNGCKIKNLVTHVMAKNWRSKLS